MTAPRDSFASKLGILAATLGSAVGLGNIWKFPALTGQYGGASFLLIYVLATLFVGLPVMMMENALGRSARANPIAAFRKMAPGTWWWICGALGVCSGFLILAFYTDVAGWVFAYVFKAMSGSIHTTDPAVAKNIFVDFTSQAWDSLFWQWVVLCSVAAIILRGASKGIEKATKILMPLLFVLLMGVGIRGLMLPGAAEGLRFLFMPDFSLINGQVILMALGLAFFKLSVGMGVMVIYGSYFRDDVYIPFMATRVMLLDLLVSVLAGIAIFPAVFSFGFEVTAGPSLLFMTIPAVFASMPGGQMFTVVFFALSAIAATGAMLSLLELPVAWLMESKGIDRRRATVLSVIILMIMGAPAALSSGVMANIKFFGMNFFDLYDFLSSNLFMPLGGLLTCLFGGYVWNKQASVELAKGSVGRENVQKVVLFICRYISPLLIVLVLLHGLKIV